MINRPNNWNDVQEVTERQKLPLGAYVFNWWFYIAVIVSIFLTALSVLFFYKKKWF